MARVTLTTTAQREYKALPRTIRHRVQTVLDRLKNWPHVSGITMLTGPWAGYYRADE